MYLLLFIHSFFRSPLDETISVESWKEFLLSLVFWVFFCRHIIITPHFGDMGGEEGGRSAEGCRKTFFSFPMSCCQPDSQHMRKTFIAGGIGVKWGWWQMQIWGEDDSSPVHKRPCQACKHKGRLSPTLTLNLDNGFIYAGLSCPSARSNTIKFGHWLDRQPTVEENARGQSLWTDGSCQMNTGRAGG